VKTIGVIGGGTAGYLSALALAGAVPQARVTLIESSAIPIIKVGEATTPLMVAFLHRRLGLEITDFFARLQPTFKLGIRFDWGPNESAGFNYPFGAEELVDALAWDGDFASCCLTSKLMSERRVPVLREAGGQASSLMPELKFAWHLDNRRFVAFLQAVAKARGIELLDAVVKHAVPNSDGSGIAGLQLEGARREFDLYVDCTGFRSLLLEGALQSRFISYADSLFCDSAVVANVPHQGVLKPYTLAQSMSSGWCWNIPQREEDHRGYVFSSAFISNDEAEKEMRAQNPGMSDAWSLRFRSGRHEEFWKGNVVAIGNSYAFVEPLESTALHMTILQISLLCRALERPAPPDAAALNARVGRHWDFLRWFLAIHYRFNRAWDSEFWRACRQKVNVSGLAAVIARFKSEGPLSGDPHSTMDADDLVFGPAGIDVLLLGQQLSAAQRPPRFSRAQWQERGQREAELLSRSLPQAEALELLASRPDLLAALVERPDSWCRRLADALAELP
jgi:tryptophan halogenase